MYCDWYLDCLDCTVGQPVANVKVAHLMLFSREKKCFSVRLLGQPASSRHWCVSNFYANFDVLIPNYISLPYMTWFLLFILFM